MLLQLAGRFADEASGTDPPTHLRLPRRHSVLATCTCFLSRKGKVEHLRNALLSLRRCGVFDEADVVVVNEYPPVPDSVLAELPLDGVTLLQKSRADRGQARSLNIILGLLRSSGYQMHLQWEESWVANADFRLPYAMRLMETLHVDQLSLTPWDYPPGVSSEHFVLPLESYRARTWRKGLAWPLFRLQPSLNQVSALLRAGEFEEDKRLWPVQFEYRFAVRWTASGGRAAIYKHPPAVRQQGHVSTYA